MLLKSVILLCIYVLVNGQIFPTTCPQLSPHDPPSDVKHLRADDFSLVMAIGDSIVSVIVIMEVIFNMYLHYRPLPSPRKIPTLLMLLLSMSLLSASQNLFFFFCMLGIIFNFHLLVWTSSNLTVNLVFVLCNHKKKCLIFLVFLNFIISLLQVSFWFVVHRSWSKCHYSFQLVQVRVTLSLFDMLTTKMR